MNPTFAIAFDLIFVNLGGLFISIIISLNSIKVVVISIVVVTVGLEQNRHIFKIYLKEFSSEEHMATNTATCASKPSHCKSEMP